MDLGLDQPGARDRLYVVLDEITQLSAQVDAFDRDPSGLYRLDNGIGELVVDHPDPHVDIRRTMLAALRGLRGSLDTLQTLVTSVATTPEVLATLCRTALLASCRLLVLVGPADIDERRANTVRVMLQESNSLGRVYRRAKDFTRLQSVIPPAGLLPLHQDRHDRLRGTDRVNAFTETDVVELAATVIAERMRGSDGDSARNNQVVAEQLVWVFNTYSGIAHAFSWPTMVPGATDRLPGDFVSDLGTTVAVAALAVQAFTEAAQ